MVADLSSVAGRTAMVAEVTSLAGGALDAVVACAGVSSGYLAEVNFFGAVATLEGLRPLLLGSAAPRAVVVTSQMAIRVDDDDIVAACLAGDEAAAVAAAGPNAYPQTKRAMSRWVRREAIGPLWAGARIPLNAVAPGVIATPINSGLLNSEKGLALLAKITPMPIPGPGIPEDVAELLIWLTSPQNTLVTGQVIFVDGGSDALLRPTTF
ncbi:MAG: SDR family oxidoreductase [Acidobacteria bacterium]|nr:SDR family oxidoreductase [Acidobacteriota bacterium]